MKNEKGQRVGASTDAGEVGTLAVSLPGLATRRVARTTVSPSAAPGLTDGSNMAKAVVTRAVAGRCERIRTVFEMVVPGSGASAPIPAHPPAGRARTPSSWRCGC